MINDKTLVGLYEEMLQIRLVEEKVFDLYKKGLVPGLPHLYIGQEAIAVGVCANLRKDDFIVGTHRGHGHAIAKGASLEKILSEILCKATGCCKGFGGSMHMADTSVGMMYCCSIVGGSLPISTGVGLSIKLQKTDQVAVGFFGDGAANIGATHESLNLASIWKLPVIYVCENNQYAISVPVSRSTSVEDIGSRAVAYDIPGAILDGNDVIAVYKAAQKAVNRARRGEGPTLMECKTYRWTGHHAGDQDTAYRSKEEIESWKEKCPIKRLKTTLLSKKIVKKKDLEKIEKRVEKKTELASKFALESPYPNPEDAYKYVYSSWGG